ncbi:hypothetical protein ACFYVK_18080 [Streptomyces chartreusis]|uniref:phosphorylase family protein n=1 Tax=Streptomyces chartreusis TaxID=1969 RepID=UPI0036ACD033
MGEVSRLGTNFRPEVFVVVGIAGGVQRPESKAAGTGWTGPNLGDVVVATFVHYADFLKNVPAGPFQRYFALDYPLSNLVAEHARSVREYDWHRYIKASPPPGSGMVKPKVHVDEIVVTERVAGNPTCADQIRLVKRFDKAQAVDMESVGVGRGVHHLRSIAVHYNPVWLSIRAISDPVRAEDSVLEAGSDEQDRIDLENDAVRAEWKPYAAAVAAAYASQVVARLLRSPRDSAPEVPEAPAFRFRV